MQILNKILTAVLEGWELTRQAREDGYTVCWGCRLIGKKSTATRSIVNGISFTLKQCVHSLRMLSHPENMDWKIETEGTWQRKLHCISFKWYPLVLLFLHFQLIIFFCLLSLQISFFNKTKTRLCTTVSMHFNTQEEVCPLRQDLETAGHLHLQSAWNSPATSLSYYIVTGPLHTFSNNCVCYNYNAWIFVIANM